MSDVWVLNASPVILLGKIGRLDLLESLAAKADGVRAHMASQSSAHLGVVLSAKRQGMIPACPTCSGQASPLRYVPVRSGPCRGSQTDRRIEDMAMLKPWYKVVMPRRSYGKLHTQRRHQARTRVYGAGVLMKSVRWSRMISLWSD